MVTRYATDRRVVGRDGRQVTPQEMALQRAAVQLRGSNFNFQENALAYDAIRKGITDPQAIVDYVRGGGRTAQETAVPSVEERARQMRATADQIRNRLRDPNRGARPTPSPFGGQFDDYIANRRPVDLTAEGNWGKYKDARFQPELVAMMKAALGDDYDKYFGGGADVPSDFEYSTRWGVPADIAAAKAGTLSFRRDPRTGLENYAKQGMAGWNQFLKDYEAMQNFQLGPGNWKLAWNTTYGGKDDAGNPFKALSAQGFWDPASGKFVDLQPWMKGMSPAALQAFAGDGFQGHYFGLPPKRYAPSLGGGSAGGMFRQSNPILSQPGSGLRRADAWQAQPGVTRRQMLEGY